MKNKLVETNEWQLLEKGKNYLRLKNVFSDVDLCNRFFNGDQWAGLKSGSVRPITYNVIKPIVKYKIGVVNSNGYDIVFSPDNYEQPEFQKEMDALCKKINKYISQTNEMTNIHKKIRKLIKKAAIVSEGVIYFTYNEEKKEISAELVNKTNIFYANENDDELQEQPYIILTFRRDVDQVRELARQNGVSEDKIELITPDMDIFEESGDYAKEEVNNQVTLALKLYKKEGKVYIKESTRTVNVIPEYNTGLTYYPLEHLTWEDEEGSARGVGVVKSNISNQIEINSTATRRSLSVQHLAYPKLAVNMDKVSNPSALNEVGTPIKFKDMDLADIKSQIGYLDPATMSPDSEKLQNELIVNTRELEGAGDSAIGQINPEDASGKAILAVQQASQQPLTEQAEKIKDLYESVGKIIFDMWQVYTDESGKDILVEVKDTQGNVSYEPLNISKEILDKLKVNIKIDVTPKTAYDRMAQEMSLENLLVKGYITFEEYVEALPMDSTMPKPILTKLLQARQEIRRKIMAEQKAINQATSMINNKLKLDGAKVPMQQPTEQMGGEQNAM